ncbi:MULTISPECIES: histidine kinase [Arthrobacter]|uniref:histidine kinase n=2 Tax=Arthrobacter TaxID=1663 RepID=A0ABU9KK18_9MICC|nr:histidine kinase [Arthrobacter sp. YJM1]MDP5226258.1 histidine kinase [Arthrobacter sp. YJM1]
MTTTGRPGWTLALLNLLGAVAVGYALFPLDDHTRPFWATATGFVAVASWAARGPVAMIPHGQAASLSLSALAAVSGGFAAAATHGLTVVPAAIGTVAVIGTLAAPLTAGVTLAVLSCGLIATGAAVHTTAVPDTLTMMGGVLLAAVAGYSRRQFRVAEEQSALLREKELLMRQEAQRVAIARDLHDVLAHSLGGLVLQLDAVEALLEAGDRDAAAARVTAARRLASDGLQEARRAVTALRDTGARMPEPSAGLAGTFTGLLEAHRSLGGVADFTEIGAAVPLTSGQQEALGRALQEALSNARRHAPGEPVRVSLHWKNGSVLLTVSNPMPDSAEDDGPRPGGGYGLLGMRERFGALPAGGSAGSGVHGDRFVVTAEVRTP